MVLKMYSENKQEKAVSKIGRTIAVAAGKGGVGKSTIAINLALALKKLNFRVGILDADIYGPSLRRMLPENYMPSKQGEHIVPALCNGISMISMAFFQEEASATAVRAPIVNKLASHFLEQVFWGELDYLIIDFPPGTGDIHLTMAQKASLTGAVIVTTPQEVALMDVRKSIRLFYQVKVPILGIIENMSGYTDPFTGQILHFFGEGGGEKLAKEYGIPLLGKIPLDPFICKSGDEGKSIFDQKEGSQAAQSFFKAANRLVEEHSEKKTPRVHKISQIDKFSFSIEWSDGFYKIFKLHELQKNCPCANCSLGTSKAATSENLSAKSVTQIGNYGLKVEFVTGCSTGIYSFDMLRNL